VGAACFALANGLAQAMLSGRSCSILAEGRAAEAESVKKFEEVIGVSLALGIRGASGLGVCFQTACHSGGDPSGKGQSTRMT